MNLLAVDTSTEYLSLAVQAHGQMHVYHANVGAAASQRVLPEIHTLLQAADTSLTALDGIAFGAGPGAFTGVRVACGVAQGLAFAADLPVVGVHTLMAVAQASARDKVIVCQDARMGEVYFAAYEKNQGEWVTVSPAIVCKPEQVPTLDGNDWVGAGSGWPAYMPQLSAVYHGQLREVLPDVTPNAQAILALAQPQFLAGLTQVAEEITPIYIRNRVALTTQERAQGLRI